MEKKKKQAKTRMMPAPKAKKAPLSASVKADVDAKAGALVEGLSEYFQQTKGIGVLATTDAAGQVNQAIYAKPIFLDKDDDATCSFIMANSLTHDNVEHNPSASYLFIEVSTEFVGKRLSLVAGEEESDRKKIKAIRRQNKLPLTDEECKHFVHFHIEGVRPLIGNEP